MISCSGDETKSAQARKATVFAHSADLPFYEYTSLLSLEMK
jgi:hypothetical protein